MDLVDARRSDHLKVKEVMALGYDLNDGMVVDYQGGLYHGDQAVQILSQLSSGVGFLNNFTSMVLKSPTRAKFLYSFLRAGRNFVLRFLGKKKI